MPFHGLRFAAFVMVAASVVFSGRAQAQTLLEVITPANAANLALVAEAPISDYGKPQVAWTADGALVVGMASSMYEPTSRIETMPAWQGMGSALDTLPNIDVRGFLDLAAHPTLPQVAIGTFDGVTLYDLTTQATALQIGHVGARVAYSADGGLIAAVDADDVVQVWNLTNNRLLAEITDVTHVTGIAFAPDSATLAIGQIEGDIYLWDLDGAQGRWMHRSDAAEHGGGGGGSPDQSVTFSPDGRYLTSVSFWEFGQVRLWDVAQERVIAVLEPLPGVQESMLFDATAFSPDGALVATTGGPARSRGDGVYLWDVAGVGERVAPNATHSDHNQLVQLPHHNISSVAFSPDGTLLATAGDGLLRLWGVNAPTQPELAAANDVNLVAYCDGLGQGPVRVTAGQGVGIVWSWYATTPELLADHLSAANYEVYLDDTLLEGWRLTSRPVRDPANDSNWTIYYTVDAPPLSAGEHTIHYRLNWDYAISDGMNDFGPDTATPEDSGTCHFAVS